MKKRVPFWESAQNVYLGNPFRFDLLASALSGLVVFYLVRRKFFVDSEDAINVISGFVDQMLSASISMAGFIFTALTVIIAIRDNFRRRPDDDYKKKIDTDQSPEQIPRSFPTGIELFFNSPYYQDIVRLFFLAIVSLVCTFGYFAMLKVFWNNLPVNPVVFTVPGFVFIMASIIRSLLVLRWIVQLHTKHS